MVTASSGLNLKYLLSVVVVDHLRCLLIQYICFYLFSLLVYTDPTSWSCERPNKS